jgi:hypothetical protein
VDVVTALHRRINCLPKTHELLSESKWRCASLQESFDANMRPTPLEMLKPDAQL